MNTSSKSISKAESNMAKWDIGSSFGIYDLFTIKLLV
jgi:hypothetical protein